MSVEYVDMATQMSDDILRKVHRGPGDTVDAAIARAERMYGVPGNWVKRLRYRKIKDMPVSAFGAIVRAYDLACAASEKAYEAERSLADARNSKLRSLADAMAGTKNN